MNAKVAKKVRKLVARDAHQYNVALVRAVMALPLIDRARFCWSVLRKKSLT